MRWIILLALLFPIAGNAQNDHGLKSEDAGWLSLGLRSTMSVFNKYSDAVGIGTGGHFRLQFHPYVNSQWFFDFIATPDRDYNRLDWHIGWSIMYYFLHREGYEMLLKPYIIGGHCFDYSRIEHYEKIKERWSGAVQAGAGTHFNITPAFDVSTEMQYMLHLGKHLDPDDYPEVSHRKGAPEGHMLFTVSINYKIASLW